MSYLLPVTGEDFFDRERELEILESGKNIALIGPRKSGKTSIIFEFVRRHPEKRIAYVYVLFQEDINSLISRMARSVLMVILRVRDEVPALDDLISAAMDKVPEISALLYNLMRHIRKQRHEEALEALANVCEKTGTVIAIDEFQNVFQLEKFVDILRMILLKYRKVQWIITGSSIGIMKELLMEPSSPLFGHFEVVWVGAFDMPTASEFLEFLLRRTQFSMPPDVKQYILAISGGFPFYISIIVSKSVEKAKTKRKGKIVPWSDVMETLEEELCHPEGTLYRHFIETLEKGMKRRNVGKYIDVLYWIAKGASDLTTISKNTGFSPQHCLKILRFLEKSMLIERVGDSYFLKDPLMDIWLKRIYELMSREYSPVRDFTQIKLMLKEYLDELRKQISIGAEARIRELLRAFDGRRKIPIAGEIVRTPTFQIVSRITWNGNEIDVLAIGSEVWVLEVKTGSVKYEDLKTFARKIDDAIKSGVIKRVDRRILACLGDIKENLVTEADKLGIKIWRKEEINKAMRIFGYYPFL